MFITPALYFIFTLPISLGSLGIREGTYIILYGLFGVPPEVALLISFFNLSGILLNNLIGGIVLLITKTDTEIINWFDKWLVLDGSIFRLCDNKLNPCSPIKIIIKIRPSKSSSTLFCGVKCAMWRIMFSENTWHTGFLGIHAKFVPKLARKRGWFHLITPYFLLA